MCKLLSAIKKLPITVASLKAIKIGKSVNQLKGVEDSAIKTKAALVVKTWKEMIEKFKLLKKE